MAQAAVLPAPLHYSVLAPVERDGRPVVLLTKSFLHPPQPDPSPVSFPVPVLIMTSYFLS